MICPKCKREIDPWPLKRGARCSPDHWVMCIRNDLPELAEQLARNIYETRGY